MEFFYEDCKSLLEEANRQEKELRHKRRLLIGLPTSRKEDTKLKGSKFQTKRPISEYLLREDDVSYEIIRSFIEKISIEHDSKNKCHILHDDMQLIHSPTDIISLVSLIDDMTNQALFQFANLLTRGPITFEKTRWNMKQTIKEYLLKNTTQETKLFKDCSSLFKNPRNFRWSNESRFVLDPRSDSSRAAAHKILNRLEDLPTQTLSAMNRKLRGIKDYIPNLIPKKSGWIRGNLIKSLRKKCFKLLSELKEGDLLQEQLANAMEAVGLTLKLIQGHRYTTNFIQFSPEINLLQNEIAMCIHLLDEKLKLKISVLKEIQILLAPEAKLLERTLRMSIKNFLIDCLFECGDIETVPQSLLQVLAIIKKNSKFPYKNLDEMRVEEEVECVLSVSASMKQVLWDLIPEHEFDLDFADAYMEDLEDSDCDVFSEDEEQVEKDVQNDEFDEEVGCNWDMNGSVNFNSNCMAVINSMKSCSVDNLDVVKSQNIRGTRYHLVSFGNVETETDVICDKDSSLEGNLVFGNGEMCKNGYLGIQGASDEVSMVAYRVIGHMLKDFAQMEECELNSGDLCYLGGGSNDVKEKRCKVARKESTIHVEDDYSIMMKAVEEIIPSFAECEADKLKELMGVVKRQ